MKIILLKFLLLWIFVIGGTIQLLGVVSNTKSTIFWILILLFLAINLTIKKRKIEFSALNISFVFLTISILASGIINSTPLSRTLFYLIFVLVPYSIHYIINNNLGLNHTKYIMKFMLFICLIQLPLVLLQTNFSSLIQKISSGKVGEHDAAFGSFFLASDISLCFFLLSLLIYILFDANSKIFIKGALLNFLFILSISITVIITNSKISHILLATIFVLFIFKNLMKHKRIGLVFSAFFTLVAFQFIAFEYDFFDLSNYGDKFEIFTNDRDRAIQSYTDPDQVPRFGPLLIFLSNDLKIIGEGPYDFYNPINKEWKYGGGHSLLYWLYNDIGIIGIALAFLSLFLMSYRKTGNKRIRFCYFSLLIITSIVTTSMSDMAIMFTYNYFIAISGTEIPNV